MTCQLRTHNTKKMSTMYVGQNYNNMSTKAQGRSLDLHSIYIIAHHKYYTKDNDRIESQFDNNNNNIYDLSQCG